MSDTRYAQPTSASADRMQTTVPNSVLTAPADSILREKQFNPRQNQFAIRCRRVCHSFGDHVVLRDLSLDVPVGRCVAIMGPSGSGKTTLLHILAGIVTPDSGTATVAGLELAEASQRSRTRHRQYNVAMVFQFGELLAELTVAENVGLPLRIRGERPGDGAIEQLLSSVGVNAPQAWPAQLSGGETQRVAVARALVTGPRVLLCDEPTGSLDADNSDRVVSLLLESARRSAATMVVSTHDASVAGRMDEVYALSHGRLTAVGSPRPRRHSDGTRRPQVSGIVV